MLGLVYGTVVYLAYWLLIRALTVPDEDMALVRPTGERCEESLEVMVYPQRLDQHVNV